MVNEKTTNSVGRPHGLGRVQGAFEANAEGAYEDNSNEANSKTHGAVGCAKCPDQARQTELYKVYVKQSDGRNPKKCPKKGQELNALCNR